MSSSFNSSLLFDALGLVAHLQNQRSEFRGLPGHRILELSVCGHLVLLRDLRLLVRIDELKRYFAVLMREQPQQVPSRRVFARPG